MSQENLLISASSELPSLSPKARPSMDHSFRSPQRVQPPGQAEPPASSSVDGLPLSELLLQSHPVRSLVLITSVLPHTVFMRSHGMPRLAGSSTA